MTNRQATVRCPHHHHSTHSTHKAPSSTPSPTPTPIPHKPPFLDHPSHNLFVLARAHGGPAGWQGRPRQGEGRGHSIKKKEVGTQCPTPAPAFSGLTAPEFYLTAPLFREVADYHNPKSNIVTSKSLIKIIQIFL